MYISNFVLETAAVTYLDTYGIHFWVNSDQVPADSPIKLTTTGLNLFFPGLVDKYGANMPMDVEFNVDSLHSIVIKDSDDTLSFHSDLSVKYWVNFPDGHHENAVSILLKDMFFNFTAAESGMQLSFDVKAITFDTIVVTSTTFGDVNLGLLAMLCNAAIKYGLSYFNAYIGQFKVDIPDTLMGLFKLTELEISYHDGYLYGGMVPVFLSPSEMIESSVLEPVK